MVNYLIINLLRYLCIWRMFYPYKGSKKILEIVAVDAKKTIKSQHYPM